MSGLSLRGVTVLRGKRLVLEDVSFTAPAGALTAVLGPPGSGKTSLLAAAAGLLKLQRGAVLLGGADVTRVTARRRGIGLLPPGSVLPEVLTVQAALRRLAGRSGAPSVEPLIEALGLARLAHAELSALSHGEALLALTAARLVCPGAALLVDEAGSGLDAVASDRLLAALRSRAAAGAPVLFATRAQVPARAADHLVLLGEGHVLQAGTPASLYAEPRDAACALLTGNANILEGNVRELRPGGFVWSAGRRYVQAASAHAARPALGGKVALCLRPERIALLNEGEAADNEVEADIAEVVSAGAQLLVRLSTGLLAAVPSWPTERYPVRGQVVRLGWSAQAAHILEPAAGGA